MKHTSWRTSSPASRPPWPTCTAHWRTSARPLTSILDRLEARGLIDRTTDVRDRRTFVISLTAQGRALSRRVSAHLAAFESRVLKRVSPRDMAAFARVLDALEETAEQP